MYKRQATGATTCQIYMRRFKDGDTITVEPWRSAGFPVIRDLMVDRSAYDKIMQAGGYVSVSYTHLDVYKRQNMDYADIRNGLVAAIAVNVEEPLFERCV